jgi:hypothetical protein
MEPIIEESIFFWDDMDKLEDIDRVLDIFRNNIKYIRNFIKNKDDLHDIEEELKNKSFEVTRRYCEKGNCISGSVLCKFCQLSEKLYKLFDENKK